MQCKIQIAVCPLIAIMIFKTNILKNKTLFDGAGKRYWLFRCNDVGLYLKEVKEIPQVNSAL
jgi:hypothetical protein